MTRSLIRRAERLLIENSALARAVAARKERLNDAEAIAAASARARFERTLFVVDPTLLIGLAEHYQRTDPKTAIRMVREYARLLDRMRQTDRVTGAPPLRIDFEALPRGARPYLLAPFLRLEVGDAYPMLDLGGSQPARGMLRYTFTSGPADPSAWRPRLKVISEWLGGHWELAATTVSSITLVCRAPLPDVIPFDEGMIAKGKVFAGIDVASRAPVHLDLADMTAGTLIAGASGTGKSVALRVILKSLLANLHLFDAVYIADGKDGIEFAPYARLSPKVRILWRERDVWALTDDLHTVMRARQEQQRVHNVRKITQGYIALVIDETSTYTARPAGDKELAKKHAEFIDNLTRLARRGRSSGFRCIFACQEPTEAQIPTSVRANCDTVLAFRLPIDAHATMVFGQLDTLSADPRRLKRGTALLRNGATGALSHVQLPSLDDREGGL